MRKLLKQTFLRSLIASVLMLAAPIGVLADGGENEITKIVPGYQISLVIEKPLAVGRNSIHFQITDSHGIPISNAEVYVSLVEEASEHTESEPAAVSKDEMSGMSSTSGQPSSAQPESHNEIEQVRFEAVQNGEYAGEIAFHEAGEWIVRAHVAVHDEWLEIDFPLSVASIQRSISLLASFFAINAAIIAAALVLKHKPFRLHPIPEVLR